MRKTTYLKKLEEIEVIIKKCDTCYVSMVDADGKPYLLPFNFGYHNGFIYLHSDPNGKKIDILKKNPAVCINFTTDHELFHINKEVACSYGMRYRSVLVHGEVEFIEDYDAKVEALNIFMKQYVEDDFTYNKPAIVNVCVFRVPVNEFSGKVYGYHGLE